MHVSQLEHAEQVMVFQWARLHQRKHPELALLYAVPNAAKRTPRQGAWMKAEGLKAGVPDLVLPVARHGFNSLYIELKVGRNKATESQVMFMDALNQQGNLAVLCIGADAVIQQLSDYLQK